MLRSVGGWGEVDLDQRAITTEDDIVDLNELERSHQQPNRPAPARQNGAAERDEPSEGQLPPGASQPDRPPEASPATDAPGREGDEDFDRWVADHAVAPGSALAVSDPRTPPLASDAGERAPGDAPTAASGTAGVPCDDPTVPAVTSSRSRPRRGDPPSRLLRRLARPAAAIGALTLAAGVTDVAINAATTSTPHARPPVATSNAAALIAGESNRASDALRAPIAPATSQLAALARAAPPAHHASHPLHTPRHRHPSHQARLPNHRHSAAAGRQNATSAQTSPPPQTYSDTRAPVTTASAPVTPSGTSQTTAGSQTHAASRSQPAFGQNGSLGPGRGAPGTQ